MTCTLYVNSRFFVTVLECSRLLKSAAEEFNNLMVPREISHRCKMDNLSSTLQYPCTVLWSITMPPGSIVFACHDPSKLFACAFWRCDVITGAKQTVRSILALLHLVLLPPRRHLNQGSLELRYIRHGGCLLLLNNSYQDASGTRPDPRSISSSTFFLTGNLKLRHAVGRS